MVSDVTHWHLAFNTMFLLFRYKIDDVDRSNLELTAKIKICLEDNTCLYESTLFDKHILPKPGCNWNLNFTIPGWMAQQIFTIY